MWEESMILEAAKGVSNGVIGKTQGGVNQHSAPERPLSVLSAISCARSLRAPSLTTG